MLLRLILLAFLSVLLTTCGPPESRPDCFKSTGPATSEHRALPAYSAVEVYDNVRLVLAADGQPYGVDVTAGRNLLPEIDADVDAKGHLVLRNRNKCNFVRAQKLPITVVVHVPDASLPFTIFHNGEETIRTAWPGMRLDSLFLHQRTAGDADLDLNATYLWVDCYEYGDLILHGRTDELHAVVGGIGFFKAQDLTARQAYVTGLSDGDIHVRANELLLLKLSGRGNGFYYGQPQRTEFEALGPGQIKQVQ